VRGLELRLHRPPYLIRALPKDEYWGLALSGERIVSKVPVYIEEEVALLRETFVPQIKAVIPLFPMKGEPLINIGSDQDLYTIVSAVVFADVVTGYARMRFDKYNQKDMTESSAQIRKALQGFIAQSICRPRISVNDYFEQSLIHLVKESGLLS